MTTLSHPLRTLALGITLAAAAVGCGSDLPTEADLPPEADLAYPGAVEIKRSFDDGETGTYIDGGSADSAPRFDIRYEVSDVDRQTILDWYARELGARDWEITSTTSRTINAQRESEDGLTFGAYVEVPQEQPTLYSMRIRISRVEE